MSCAERAAPEAALPRPPPSRRPQQPPPELEHDFVEEPAREFYCAVSLELLREPKQTDCCGHHLSLEVARERESLAPCANALTSPLAQTLEAIQVGVANSLSPVRTAEAGSVERCSLEQHLLECPLQLVGCEYVCGHGVCSEAPSQGNERAHSAEWARCV